MIYDFNLKEVGPGFNMADIHDLPVIKVWDSNVSQKERYVALITIHGQSTTIADCFCKAFRDSSYPNHFDWGGTVEKEVNGGHTYYYYRESTNRTDR